jgi:hypothetical protein
MKKTGNLTKDFDCIILHAIGSRVIDELMTLVPSENIYSKRNELIDELSQQALDCYKAQCKSKSGEFYRIKDATMMRDSLTVFFRHWLSSLIHKQFPKEYKGINHDFKNGVYNN